MVTDFSDPERSISPTQPRSPAAAGAPASVARVATGPNAIPFRRAGDLVAGRYRLLRAVGGGAMGTLFAAEDTWRGEHVAVKVVRHELGEPTFYGELLAREARLAGRVEHPNVCRVLETGRDGQHFMIMELLDGESLEERMLRAPLSLEESVRILDEVAAGLDAVHHAGIVHRDLKPGNIFLEAGSGRVKLIDFGIAAIARAKWSETEPTGTPAFWSPEQSRGEPPAPSSDVYALGRTAFSLFANLPLEPETLTDLSRVPLRFRGIVARCVAERPEQRYADLAEFRADLASALRPRRSCASLTRAVAARVGITFLAAALGFLAVTHHLPERAHHAAAEVVGILR